jgi:hypothetical protein
VRPKGPNVIKESKEKMSNKKKKAQVLDDIIKKV